MDKQQLLRNIIVKVSRNTKLLFLGDWQDNLEKGVLLELSGDWSEFVGH